MTDKWRPGYPACSGSEELDGPNFVSPVMANTVVPEMKRLREAEAFATVAKEARLFHERKAQRHGIDTPVGLAHFRAATAYRESTGHLQEMFEDGGTGSLSPHAVACVNKAAIKFHKKAAEKAGLHSSHGKAHIAAIQHHLKVLHRAKQLEAKSGFSGKQSPVPVPNKRQQPSEDIRQPLPPVPLKKLQQKEGGAGSGPQGQGSGAGRFLHKELGSRYMKSKDVPDVTSYKKESRGKGWAERQKDMHKKMSKRSMESCRTTDTADPPRSRKDWLDTGVPNVIDLGAVSKKPERTPGWKGGLVYSPPVEKINSISNGGNLEIKEY